MTPALPHSEGISAGLAQYAVCEGLGRACESSDWSTSGGLQYGALQREAAREYGITVQTVDLSEIIGKAERLRDDEAVVRESFRRYSHTYRPRVCQKPR